MNIPLVALSKTEAIARYMKLKFLQTIHQQAGNIPFPPAWDYQLVLQCNHAVRVLAEAYQNQGELFSHVTLQKHMC